MSGKIENINNNCVEGNINKKCFIITPIGDETMPIRRHIDGLIDECIIPVLKDRYKVNVAHRITTPGSINDQVIQEIYESELVIANLTKLNPNVMYELAFRHALRKPVIIIMEKDKEHKIPFDIVTERTIFYDNDFQGAIDLKNRLFDMVNSIENLEGPDLDNPIYSTLTKMGIKESIVKKPENQENITEIQYIIKQLDDLQKEIAVSRTSERTKKLLGRVSPREDANVGIYLVELGSMSSTDNFEKIEKLISRIIDYRKKSEYRIRILNKGEKSVIVNIEYDNEDTLYKIVNELIADGGYTARVEQRRTLV